jgi:hypothetical protein
MVLLERATETHVDELETAADPEHRQVVRERLLEERELEGVARFDDVVRGHVRFVVSRRIDVAAAGEAQAVERAGHRVGRVDRDRLATGAPDRVQVLLARDHGARRGSAGESHGDAGSHPRPWYSV